VFKVWWDLSLPPYYKFTAASVSKRIWKSVKISQSYCREFDVKFLDSLLLRF